MSPILLELPSHARASGGLWYSTPASTRFGAHFHEELELNVLVTGVVHYRFPHREMRVVGPSALWIPPRMEHELLDSSNDLSMWVYSFRVPGRRRSLAARGPEATLGPSKAVLAVLTDGPLVTGIAPDALGQLSARSRAGLLRPGRTDFDAILADVFARAWSGRNAPAARQRPCARHPAALRAARLLRESDGSLSMAALAHRSSLSRERLSRLFTQSHGIGLVQYRNHHLVQRFIHNYGHGSCANMLRAAFEVGFGSYAQFHRAFTQVTGYPPSTHLERVRDGIVDPERTG